MEMDTEPGRATGSRMGGTADEGAADLAPVDLALADRGPAGRDAAGRDAAGRDAAGMAPAGRDAADMDAAQRRLAEAQARVVAALVAGAEPPEGFDPERMRAQAASLISKRRSVVARLRPDAAAASGGDLAAEFAAYARARTAPPPDYRTDADDFAAWLRGRGRLPDPPRRRRWWSRLLP